MQDLFSQQQIYPSQFLQQQYPFPLPDFQQQQCQFPQQNFQMQQQYPP
jgi:hypothetical protein